MGPCAREFYHPAKEYNVRVASRYFKGPELLVDLQVGVGGAVAKHLLPRQRQRHPPRSVLDPLVS